MSGGADHDGFPLSVHRCVALVHQRQMAEEEADQPQPELQTDPATWCIFRL